MYSPNRSPLSQYNRPAGGDRFIPTRSLMDMDFARSVFSHPTPVKKTEEEPFYNLTPQDEYRRRIEEYFKLDSEGNPRRILSFGTPNRTQKKLSFDHLFQNKSQLTHSIKPLRHVSTCSSLMLDAPYIKDDLFLNLLDWGKENIIAIALGLSVYLYNHATRATQHLLEADSSADYPASLAWAPDGRTLAVGFATSRLEIWDAIKLQPVGTIEEEHIGRVGALSWNNNLLSSGGRDGIIINHDVRLKGAKISKLSAHKGEISGLSWSENGARLASCANDGFAQVWDRHHMTKTGKYLHRFKSETGSVSALAWCPFKTHTLATGSTNGSIKIYNTQIGKYANSIDTNSQVGALEWNKHQKEILSAQENNLILRSYPSMRKMAGLRGHYERILNLSQSPDGTMVASASADETLRFWNVFGPPSKKDDEDASIFSLKRMHIR